MSDVSSNDVPEPEQLPDDVRALLRERIESYEQLEALLVLQKEGGRTADELCARLRVPLTLVESALRDLQSCGLVQPQPVQRQPVQPQREQLPPEPAGRRYVYVPETPALAAAVSRLAAAYAQDPVPIIKLMSSNAIQRLRTGAVRAFADSFILRKDKDK